jgi:hypothetical protein
MRVVERADLRLSGRARTRGEPTTQGAVDESVDRLIAPVARRIRRAGVIATIVGAIDTFAAVGAVLAVVVGQSRATSAPRSGSSTR